MLYAVVEGDSRKGERMNRTNIVIGIILSLFFVVLLSLYWDFVLDDAFITFRYAQNDKALVK